ncbi:MAG: hemerythrin domain-containing protein [Microthrixaceae bacterium]
MDAITLLKNDHRTVEQLFKRYEDAGDSAYVEKRRLVDRIIEELSRHAAIEEQLFYPAARAVVDDVEDVALESIEEHHIVKWELSELEKMDPRDERFDAKVTVLIENVRHHVEEEEGDFFPKVREQLGRNDLGELGDAMETARKVAPTRPHPRSPQMPPGNLVTGAVASVTDRVGDTAKGTAIGVVNVAKRVVSLVPGISLEPTRPTGSRLARSQAERVRDGLDNAVDSIGDTAERAVDQAGDVVEETRDRAEDVGTTMTRTARTATRGAAKTAKTAKAGAKGTATSARKGASAARTTAKRGATSTGRTAKKSANATKRAATTSS